MERGVDRCNRFTVLKMEISKDNTITVRLAYISYPKGLFFFFYWELSIFSTNTH